MAPSGLVEKTFFAFHKGCCSPYCCPQSYRACHMSHAAVVAAATHGVCLLSHAVILWVVCLPFKPNMFKAPSGTFDPATSGVRSIIPDGMECPASLFPGFPLIHPWQAGNLRSPLPAWTVSLQCLPRCSVRKRVYGYFFFQKVSMTTGAMAELWLLVKLWLCLL